MHRNHRMGKANPVSFTPRQMQGEFGAAIPSMSGPMAFVIINSADPYICNFVLTTFVFNQALVRKPKRPRKREKRLLYQQVRGLNRKVLGCKGSDSETQILEVSPWENDKFCYCLPPAWSTMESVLEFSRLYFSRRCRSER